MTSDEFSFSQNKNAKIGYILPCFLCYSFTENQIVVINQDLTFLFEIPQENLKICFTICLQNILKGKPIIGHE